MGYTTRSDDEKRALLTQYDELRSRKPQVEAAKEIGLTPYTLKKWRDALGDGDAQPLDTPTARKRSTAPRTRRRSRRRRGATITHLAAPQSIAPLVEGRGLVMVFIGGSEDVERLLNTAIKQFE